MKETIYLVVTRSKVERMTKNLPQLDRGEIPVKLHVTVDEKAFREPVIEKHVEIDDWREGVDIADVEFRGSIITQDEADVIKQRRLARMREILESQGFNVTAPDEHEVPQ
jgi:hypothetical protein